MRQRKILKQLLRRGRGSSSPKNKTEASKNTVVKRIKTNELSHSIIQTGDTSESDEQALQQIDTNELGVQFLQQTYGKEVAIQVHQKGGNRALIKNNLHHRGTNVPIQPTVPPMPKKRVKQSPKTKKQGPERGID